jgi:Spy/CpxP family protein refolding chaperone
MKILKASLLAMIALGSLVAFGPVAAAPQKKADKVAKPKAQAGERKAKAPDRLRQMTEELKLTGDQQAKVRDLFKEEAAKRKELRQNSSLTQAERRAKSRQIRQKTEAKIKEVLTPEQKEKWQKSRPEQAKKAKPAAPQRERRKD